jgi:hypothetical protein
MTTATETGYAVVPIPEAVEARGDGERQYLHLRSALGIGSFAINAVRAGAAGTQIIREHSETGPGADRQEELYLVLAGHALFTVAGEEVDAPQGTAVHVADPDTPRGAVTTEDGTIVAIVGGRPGEAFRPSPGEAMRDFMAPYEAKDYPAALEVAKGILHRYPGNPLALYNTACAEALTGNPEAALKHLSEALAGAESLRENAKTDEDFASLRGDERFEELVAD